MKGEVLHYDDNVGTGQISGADGIRYSFTRADLKQLVPVGRGTKVDFDFEGKLAKDIYIDAPGGVVHAHAATGHAAAAAPASAAEPQLSLWGYFVRAYTTKFAKFSGRARRKEYWAVVLFSGMIFVFGYLLVIGGLLVDPPRYGSIEAIMQAATENPVSIAGLAIMAVWGLVSILPGAGLLFRRVHDVGGSGWIAAALLLLTLAGYFIEYVGLIAAVAVLVIAFIPGNPGDNRYGPSPK